MSPRLRQRLRESVPSFLLAATIFVPLLLTRPGRVGADTKTYLYLDPGRMLQRATSMWDPNIGLGTVTHQNIGYLWPMGPFYWLADQVGLPDWVAQRLWLGAILFFAGLGVRFMLKTMGQEGPHVTAATFCYALTPYVLTLAARLSVILLPYTGLPWMIGLTVLALRRKRWREPALFALLVATIGSVNATALLLAGTAPLLWILHEVVVTREVRFRDAAAVVGRIGLLTIGCSLWWMAGLWAQGGYGIEILRYTETAETVATASLSLEVLRGLGYWFFYGEDRFGPWIAPSRPYMRRLDLIAASYLLPGLGLIGLAVARFRERVFFAALLVLGVLLAVGAHPWDDPPPAGHALRAFLESDLGLSMRSLPRAAPLVVLALSVFIGALVAAISADRARLARPLAAGVVALAVLALPPLWRGQLVDANLDRPEDIPRYWLDAAGYLDQRLPGTRVLEVPGADFASYRWGTTVDPILPGLMDRPYAARELIPYGSPPSADLLDALDHRMQESTLDPQAVAPIARYLGVGDISVRSDLTYERYNTPRPRLLWGLLAHAPDLTEVAGFGPRTRNVPRAGLPLVDETELQIPPSMPDPPKVGVLTVADPERILRTAPTDQPVVLAGNGDGLVDAASAGLVDGHELVLYSASYAADPAALRRELGRHAALVLTDSNRRAAQRWGTVRDNLGITERAGQKPLVVDPKDQRLEVFPDAGDRQATVIVSRGGVRARASSYGNSVSLTPEDNPVNAVDGSPATAWRTGGFSSATGETLRLEYRKPLTTDRLRVLQAIGGVQNRSITKVEVSFDGGKPLTYDLGPESHPEAVSDARTAGQVLRFPSRTFSYVDITIAATLPGTLPRYDGISSVGFSEIVAVDRDGTQPVADDVVRLPDDLLDVAGKQANDHPLAVVVTRQRVSGTVAVRSSPEGQMARTFSLPAARAFTLSGQVRLSPAATDTIIDTALGQRDALHGGVTATSKRRLPGGLTNRAMSAIDGDPDTWYSPGFLDQHGEYLDYWSARTLRFDRFSLTVLNDGRHSVPKRLRLEVDGDYDPALTVTLPAIPDQREPNARHTFQVELPKAVTGHRVRIAVDEAGQDPAASMRNVTTLDWFTGKPVIMPMGFVEVGIPGLHAPAMPATISAECRTDLLEVNGHAVGVSLQGTTADLLAGRPVGITGCHGQALHLPAGATTLRTAPGATSGFDLDRLVLRSAAGGGADRTHGVLVDAPTASQRPRIRVTAAGRTVTDLVVTDASKPFWLVLGQSHNAGWHASVDGRDLGPATLVNGYANGWQLPAGRRLVVHLEWTPQRVVRGALAASTAAVLLCLVLALGWPRRRRRGAGARAGLEPLDETWIPLDARPGMPQAFAVSRVLRFAGPTPSRFALVTTIIGAGAGGWAFIGPVPGAVLGIAAALCLRVPRARPLLTIGGPVLFAGCVGWLGAEQLFRDLPSGFDWPTYFEGVQQPALLAVGLLALDPVIDRCWLRRWWLTRDSPS